ncbi:DVUA0089 family protein [Rheinheimera sp. NSM]|uniref:DVUA0089 family protein n=1 Tax=Rheinheimera sp. NSM TaxID=3457884 RepID=UPI004037426A
MKATTKLLFVLATAVFAFAVKTHATPIVINAALHDYQSNQSYYRTVDFYQFSSTGGLASFDILAWGYQGSYLDSMLWLFQDDGDLGVSALLTQNDDFWSLTGRGFTDGSTSALDSYLSFNFSAGNYLLAVGSCCNYGAHDIIDGMQWNGAASYDNPTLYRTLPYQLTVNGAVSNFRPQDTAISNIPEPASIALLGMGLLALRLYRKKAAV